MAVAISIVAIIIFWQVHDHLVRVVKLGEKSLIKPEHHFLRIKMGLHPRAFNFEEKGGWSLSMPVYLTLSIFCSP